MNNTQNEAKSVTVRMIKAEVYKNFSRVHRAMADVLIDEGKVRIVE
ncbi:MAG TPA: hypothetical protein VN372_00930 [Methanospirillum sp.]|nr:hypothetical protein [Methanospirillum sp.]